MHLNRSIWAVLATIHIGTVVCGACSCFPDRSAGSAARTIHWYGLMSGANSGYGFFAPEVGAVHRARFLLQDSQGNTWWDSFDRTSSSEARLRLMGIVDCAFMAGEAQRSPKWRQQLVSSWAATMFTRNADAKSLTVLVELYDVPTMGDYESGSRPRWNVVYRAEFSRNAEVAQAGSRK